MMLTMTVAQKQALQRDGYLILRQVIPDLMVNKARRIIFERMGKLRFAAAKAASSGDPTVLEEANQDMGRANSSEAIMNLFFDTPVKTLLESALGQAVYPPSDAQLATLYPAEDDDSVNEAGFRNADTPFAGWCGHLDGLWNGGGPVPPVDRVLSPEEETTWQSETGRKWCIEIPSRS